MNRLLPLLLGSTLISAGCYDSTWGETKRAQKRAAQASTPSEVRASPLEGRAAEHVTPFRVRVVATTRYTSQTIDTQKQVRELFDEANRILEPSVGAHLEMDPIAIWPATNADDDLKTALEALQHDEPGDGAELVVGLVGGLPRVTDSFHEVGYALVLGKHIVLRAAARQEESDRIDKAYDELSEEERTRLRTDRKAHRALAVFLHEIGHTLGAPHERATTSLMHDTYDKKMAGFSLEATEMMRTSVARRSQATNDHPLDVPALAGELAKYLRAAQGSTWTEEERARSLAYYDGLAAHGASKQAAAAPAQPIADPPKNKPDPVAGMRDTDRVTWEKASQWFRAGYAPQAYEVAKGLFATYPDMYAVQDMRCQLAVLRRLDTAAREKECAPLARLTK